MADDIQNKNASSEDDLGTVHRLVTQGIKMKIGAAIKKAKRSGKVDKLSMSDLMQAGRWCQYNKIVGKAAADEELGAVVDELDAIRQRQRKHKITAVGD